MRGIPECLQVCNLWAPGLWYRRAKIQFRRCCTIDQILNWCIGLAQTAWHPVTKREALPHTNPYYPPQIPYVQIEIIAGIRQLFAPSLTYNTASRGLNVAFTTTTLHFTPFRLPAIIVILSHKTDCSLPFFTAYYW